uniref:Down syndrome cell adhesion molecule-like protein Dscam2 n=1 Tax=Strigamia maritima TaxID=126957 RepID=T1JD47_STRMM
MPAHARLVMVVLIFSLIDARAEEEAQGPEFIVEPPNQIDFSNSTGAILECSARGWPTPAVSWVQVDGTPVSNVSGLREALTVGKLAFLPFRAEDYRQDVHAVHYRCVAVNSVGSVISREVQVRAVLLQVYDVHVYDTYVISGNTGVLKCHIPSVLSDFVRVISWTRDEAYIISPTHSKGKENDLGDDWVFGLTDFSCLSIDPNAKYVVMPNGDLHIRHARTNPKGNVPPKLTDTVTKVKVKQGDILVIPCVAHGNPAPKFKWYVKPERNVQHLVHLGDRAYQTASSLVLVDPQVSDGGIYICEAQNSVATERAEIKVMVTVSLSAKIEPAVLIAEEKQAAIFKCYPSGFPITGIIWLKNGRVLMKINHNISHVSELKVESADLESRGMYQCVVKNSQESSQASGELRLKDAAPVLKRGFSDKVLQPGPGFSLQCVAVGSPPPSVTWTLDGITLKSGKDRVSVYTFLDPTGDVVSTFNVSNTRTEDGGLYRCIVKNKAGIVEYMARVNIFGKPAVRKTPKLAVVAGNDIWVDCPMYGYPIDNITWEKDGRSLPFDLRQSLFRNGTIKITNVQRGVDSGRYTCIVNNKHGQAAKEDKQLVVMVAPKLVPFSFHGDYLYEGGEARVSCVVSQGDLPISLQWKKDGRRPDLEESVGLSIRVIDDYSSLLTIENVQRKHSGTYSCIARNEAGVAEYHTHLAVNVPPWWVIQPQDKSVVLGGSILINCSADGFPKPVISWTKVEDPGDNERKEVISSSSVLHVFTNGSLWIKQALIEHKGRYFCQATNGIGGGLSTPINILVHSPPIFDIKYRNQTVRKGESFEVPCEARGDYPINIEWIKDGEERIGSQADSRYAVKEGTVAEAPVSHLHVMAADRRDTAVFTCIAENAFGRDEANINIIVQEPPDFPQNVSVANVESRDLILEWITPFDGNSRITKYVVQYQPLGSNWQNEKVNEVSVNGKETVAPVAGLSPATSYHFRVLAENMLGTSALGEEVNVTMAEEAPAGPPESAKVEAVNPQTLKVSWKAPKPEQWNGKLRGYNIGHRIVGNGVDSNYIFRHTDLIELSADDLHTFITDLQKFTQYGVAVQAYNDAGKGPLSKEVVAMTSEDVPSKPPQELRCTTLTSQSIHVTWQPPPSDSTNGILRGFKIFYKPIKEWYDDATIQEKIDTPKKTLKNLEKFTNYSLQVLAYTKMGDGVASSPIYCRTLDDVPIPPADIKAIPSSVNSIVVGWLPPSRPNGLVKQYTLYRKIPGQRFENAVKYVIPASSLSYEVTSLKKTQRYEFWVTASTSAGEGPGSTVVTQIPNGPIVPARALSFSEPVLTAWKNNVKLLCEAVGSPTPDKKWIINGDHVQQNERIRILKDGSLQFENVHRTDAGNYTCVVQNGFGDDSVTYAIIVLVPPAAPALQIVATTPTTIEIAWSLPDDGGIRIQGYTLNLKREFGQWEQMTLSPEVRNTTLTNLECGTRYHLYLFAFNKVGMGSPSEVAVPSTEGTVPNVPPMETVIEPGVTSVTLNLYAWKNKECPIQYFVVEYKLQMSSDWSFVSNNIKPEQRKLVIPGLIPAMRYDLRMTAHNTAGSSVAAYKFATLKVDGGTVEPEIEKIDHSSSLSFFSDIRIVIPICISVTAICVILVVSCLCMRRRKGTSRRRVKAIPRFLPRAYGSKKHSSGHGHSGHQHKKKPAIQKPPRKGPVKKIMRDDEFRNVTPRTPAPDYDPPPIPGSEDGYNRNRIQMLHPVHGPSAGCSSPSFLRGLRVVHPMAIPTAPPMSETSSLAYEPSGCREPSPGFARHSGAARGQQVSRRSSHGVTGEETTFVFPTSFQDDYSEVVDAKRDRKMRPRF